VGWGAAAASGEEETRRRRGHHIQQADISCSWRDATRARSPRRRRKSRRSEPRRHRRPVAAVAIGKERARLRRYILTKTPRRKRRRYLFLFLEAVVLVLVEHLLVPPMAFDLSTYTDKSARKAFCFDLAGIVELYTKLRLPKVIITKQGYRATGLDPLDLVLRRLDAPDRHDAWSFNARRWSFPRSFSSDRSARDKFGGLICSSGAQCSQW
jgi:hypothetical protein